jgi:hypothetical protein
VNSHGIHRIFRLLVAEIAVRALQPLFGRLTGADTQQEPQREQRPFVHDYEAEKPLAGCDPLPRLHCAPLRVA